MRPASLRRSRSDGRCSECAPDRCRQAVTSLEGTAPFGLVVIAVKALALPEVIPTIRPAIGRGIRMMPLLNGVTAHVDALEEAFPGHVLGGIVKIVALGWFVALPPV